jgi:hypothetical protein
MQTTAPAVAVKEFGVSETKEAIVAMFAFVAVILPVAADGLDIKDLFTVASKTVGDSEFKAIVAKAVEGKELISAEMSNLSFTEIIELGMFTLNHLKTILA